jgi:predicted nucleic-acid-binding protein
MTAVDTNILVRFLVKDDRAQMSEAVSMAENGLDFADALHLASSKGVEIIYLKNYIFRLIRESRL